MRRAARWRRADGWVWRGLGTAALVAGFFVALVPVGAALAWVADLLPGGAR